MEGQANVWLNLYPNNRKGGVKMGKKQGLSARKLLEGVYNALKKDGRKIKLPSKATAEIANDSDWHRTRIGYTGYESATLLKIGDKEWAIAFGAKCGSYPADPYNCDIAAVQLSGDSKPDEEVASEIHDALERNIYFRHSLIYAMADGQLALNKDGHFSKKVLEFLRPKVQEFIAQELETDSRYFTMDLRPVVKSAIQYKPKFVDFLCDTLREVLAS